jgi:hypothetical protein
VHGKELGNRRPLLVRQQPRLFIADLRSGARQPTARVRGTKSLTGQAHPAMHAAPPGVDPEQVLEAKVLAQDGVHDLDCDLQAAAERNKRSPACFGTPPLKPYAPS